MGAWARSKGACPDAEARADVALGRGKPDTMSGYPTDIRAGATLEFIRLTAENGHEVSTQRDSGRKMRVTGGLGFPMSMCAAEEPGKRSSKAVGKPGVTSAIRRPALLFVTTVGG